MHETIALFDLDNTLVAGDSDYAWCQFLIDANLPTHNAQTSPAILHKKNKDFMQAHMAGTLDMQMWWDFSVGLMAPYPIQTLRDLRDQFMRQKITSMIAPAAPALLASHQDKNHTLIMVTATNYFVAAPIAEHLGIPHVLATQLEEQAGYFSGKPVGTWCFREGKLDYMQDWLEQHNANLNNSIAYSDSQNDIPMLEAVSTAVAVDPDATLLKHAREREWDVISLRAGKQVQPILP